MSSALPAFEPRDTAPAPPAPAPPPAASPAAARRRAALLAVALLAVAFAFQGTRPLAEPDEGRYAEIAREMVEDGDALLPRLNGVPHLAKPPGAYWMAALGIGAFGPTPRGARLMVGVAFAAWIAAAAALGFTLTRRGDAAAWSAVALATSALPFVGGSLLTADIFLATLQGAAVVMGVRALVDPARRRAALRLFWALLGAAFFVKGFPALLPLLGLAVAWPRRVGARAGERPFDAAGLTAFALLGLWWFAWLAATDLHGFTNLLFEELWQRPFGNGMNRHKPAWVPLAALVLGTLPWGPLLLARMRGAQERLAAPGPRMLAAWCAGGLLIFTLSRGRMWLYVLPLTLAIAVGAGLVVADMALRRTALGRTAAVLAALLAVGLVAARANGETFAGYREVESLARLVAERQRPGEPVLLLQPVTLPGLAFALEQEPVLIPRFPHWPTVIERLAGRPEGFLVVARWDLVRDIPRELRLEQHVVDRSSGMHVARVRRR